MPRSEMEARSESGFDNGSARSSRPSLERLIRDLSAEAGGSLLVDATGVAAAETEARVEVGVAVGSRAPRQSWRFERSSVSCSARLRSTIGVSSWYGVLERLCPTFQTLLTSQERASPGNDREGRSWSIEDTSSLYRRCTLPWHVDKPHSSRAQSGEGVKMSWRFPAESEIDAPTCSRCLEGREKCSSSMRPSSSLIESCSVFSLSKEVVMLGEKCSERHGGGRELALALDAAQPSPAHQLRIAS